MDSTTFSIFVNVLASAAVYRLTSAQATCREVDVKFKSAEPVFMYTMYTECNALKPVKIKLSEAASTMETKRLTVTDGTVVSFDYASKDRPGIPLKPADASFVVSAPNVEINCKTQEPGDAGSWCTCAFCSLKPACANVKISQQFGEQGQGRATYLPCGAVNTMTVDLKRRDDSFVEDTFKVTTGSKFEIDVIEDDISTTPRPVGSFVIKDHAAMWCTTPFHFGCCSCDTC